MTTLPISKTVGRRYALGRQGLWPGRRWAGKDGTAQALHYIESLQMDPLNVIARSHDLALWGRVLDYQSDHLDNLMYGDRAFFDYGSHLRIYPMQELPYWRMVMQRKGDTTRWAGFAEQNGALLNAVRAELRARGPLGNRDFTGRTRVTSYRGRKDSALALYYLWLTGELMIHHRVGFERVYDFRENIVPTPVSHEVTVTEAEQFFARKVFGFRGWCTARGWASWMSFFVERPISQTEARGWVDRMMTDGIITSVSVEGEKNPYYLLTEDVPLLESVHDGHVPDDWQPLDTTTQEEVVFLAPLETVSAGGRAQALFDFEYIWEVYKLAAKRRWGYYTLPILYGDQLVARLDPKLDRATETLVIKGFWFEDERLGNDPDFVEALARSLTRLATFLRARHVVAPGVRPARLGKRLEMRVRESVRFG
ncbi:MAG TPA: crosslink repair DNA glycosylase YcaQ family protein [Candidatus Tectomicrobia bacterium]|nr:crosslink repair DNA glycosylase YcaQ family protein [Candidatus Tectomicrobia bacterium]